jgi:hypothetical protein
VENQHRKIVGYRELDEGEIALMNQIKAHGVALAELVERLRPNPNDVVEAGKRLDQRWVSIGETHLQQGLMALTRAVAKPEFF